MSVRVYQRSFSPMYFPVSTISVQHTTNERRKKKKKKRRRRSEESESYSVSVAYVVVAIIVECYCEDYWP